MLKIIYPICAGLDVHKHFIFACIASTDERDITSYKHHRFTTFTKGLRELAERLKAYSCSDVCMESTEKYRIAVYNVLELSCKIVLAYPKYVRAITDHLLNCPEDKDFDFRPLLQSSLKKKAESSNAELYKSAEILPLAREITPEQAI